MASLGGIAAGAMPILLWIALDIYFHLTEKTTKENKLIMDSTVAWLGMVEAFGLSFYFGGGACWNGFLSWLLTVGLSFIIVNHYCIKITRTKKTKKTNKSS